MPRWKRFALTRFLPAFSSPAALSSYEQNLLRITNVQGLPLEALQSIQALAAARRDYLRAVTDFNIAQFALLRAVGWQIRNVDGEAAR